MFRIDWEPFNGMAHRPWLMFWGLILSVVLWTVMLLLCVFAGFDITSEEETTFVEAGFTAYTEEKSELHLCATNGKTYTILYYKYYDGIFDNPSYLCNGDSYTLWINDGGYIQAMNDASGQQMIDFESERQAYRSSQRIAVVLMAVFLLLTTAFFALVWVVSKNPEWYPAWLVKLLFANASEFGA